MITNQVFLKKTKRGNILKIVREHYLRDDVWCGSAHCTVCRQTEVEKILAAKPQSISNVVPASHYLLLDTNIILDQIDLLEENVLQNVIILQTVWQEVKHKSSTVYNKLRDIVSNPARRFHVFVNEHRKETYIERNKGESMNDRNDRAIRIATHWYRSHLGSDIDVVLLTDDANNRENALKEGLTAFTAAEYVAGIVSNPGLADKLTRHDVVSEDFIQGSQDGLFPVHLTPLQVQDGIRAGKLLQGTFLASSDNFLEGQVNVQGRDEMILIQGRMRLNRAIEGDSVVVELLPEAEWATNSELVLLDDDDAENVEKVLKNEKPTVTRPSGRIVAILRRKWRQYCGIIQANSVEGSTRHLFVPAERKIPKIRIETRQSHVLLNQRILVAIDSWPRHSRYPVGHFVRALGPIGEKETENEVLLLEHDIPHSKFSEAVLSCLPQLPWLITDQDLLHRKDLRDLDICSVDPPGCTDIDDALHCRLISEGVYEVGVHIADVTHFIKPGTAIDKEAASRATTVYLSDKRIDMVPGLLSSNLCSLRGGEDRFAFSIIWQMTSDAQVLSVDFQKSVIRSRAALTYEQAQYLIDDCSNNDAVTQSLRVLNNLAKILKQRRIDHGALLLASPEVRFQVDSETHDPIQVQVKTLRDTNSLVEEFMLLANVTVAEKIYKEFPECAMLRRHPEPPLANFEPLLKATKSLGFDMDVSSSKLLAKSLDDAVNPGNSFFNTMLRILATRCMMQAVYFSSGMLPYNDYHHYGLACPIYTHFTSPIRRYADVVVHRLLAAAIGAESTFANLLDKRTAHELCHNLNYRNRMAQYAGRASVALHTHLFFRGRIQDEEGYILYVKKNALQILIPKYGLEGTMFVSGRKELQHLSFIYDDNKQTQKCGSVVFSPFDPVTVQLSLDSTNIQREKLLFKLVKPYIEGFSVPSISTSQKRKSDSVDTKNPKK